MNSASPPHYAEAGAYLLGLWGLPMPIVEAVAYQRRPGQMRSSGFWVTGAVHVASALVAGLEPDETYLRSVGMLDKLPQWRELVDRRRSTKKWPEPSRAHARPCLRVPTASGRGSFPAACRG